MQMQLRSQSEVVYFCITYECCVYNIMFYVACMHVNMYICMYEVCTCMYVRMYVCMYVCMYEVCTCMYARMYLCMYVCSCMYTVFLRSDAAATISLLFVLVRLQIEGGYKSRVAFG